MGKNGVTGVIIPLDSRIIDRVFHHRPIIAAFVESMPTDAVVGDRVFLYDSGGARVLEGEGSILDIRREKVSTVRDHGAEFSLSGPELDSYVASSGKREDDEMLVIVVADAVKYSRALRCSGTSVKRDWVYMTDSVYSAILAEN